MRTPESKILDRAAMAAEAERLRAAGRTIAFTNGAYDLLHAGHLASLLFARQQADVLVVGVNADDTIRRTKGQTRPIIGQQDRVRMLAALECVDYVVLFEEDEPRALLEAVRPDVLVKGAQWAHFVAGRDIVEAYGGRILLAPMVDGLSTTEVIGRILGTRTPPAP